MTVAVSPSLRLARIIALAVPVCALGGAYIGQYAFGLFPCEMCWWQRYPHFVALVLALLAFWWRPVRPLVAVAGLALLVTGLIGGYHAGVEYHWWKGVTECTSTVFSGGGGSSLDAVLSAPLIRCDVAQWSLFGISLAGWNFLFSTAGAIAIFLLLTRREKRFA
ncbi:disulfide bond formation protein B [Novosphingobium sp. 9]|uniref:disulfide bond formation protein B n=1 Tax=Novosphingobium sp. 9 TaxID=2025349 RepID=UPI0021B6CC41|nr:disulfide bond formation protein B [Novosphingobium sp. 9]